MDAPKYELPLPLFTYLVEPGPGRPRAPGFLGNTDRGLAYVPIWTKLAGLQAFLETQKPSQVSVLKLQSTEDLIAFLESIPPKILEVTFDPVVGLNMTMTFLTIGELLRQLKPI